MANPQEMEMQPAPGGGTGNPLAGSFPPSQEPPHSSYVPLPPEHDAYYAPHGPGHSRDPDTEAASPLLAPSAAASPLLAPSAAASPLPVPSAAAPSIQHPGAASQSPAAPNPAPHSGGETKRPQGEVRGIAWWQTPALAVGFFVGSLVIAGVHHGYYLVLGGTLVQSPSQQAWALRIGTGLAFLVKVGFSTAVGIAGVQEMWATLRRKSMSIAAIDGMFAIMASPTAALNIDLLAHAKLLLMLAVASW